MNIGIIALCLALLIIFMFFLMLIKKQKVIDALEKRIIHMPDSPESTNVTNSEVVHENEYSSSSSGNFTITDQLNRQIITAHELFKLPRRSIELDASTKLGKRTKDLLSGAVKAGISIPNRTVELAFKSDIQEGLDAGEFVLMRTKAGETLADAVDNKTGQIVGKGRLVEGGKVKQLTAGVFQVASIAVAQSHLADIDNSLKAITSTIKSLQDKQNIIEKSKILGAISYFEKVKVYIEKSESPYDVSSAIASNVENCVKESHQWTHSVLEQLNRLKQRVDDLSDVDTFGTGDTFLEFKQIIKELELVAMEYNMLMQLSNISEAILGYLDPKGVIFTRMDIQHREWESLVNSFVESSVNKASDYFQRSGSIWNAKDTLEIRHENVINYTRITSGSIIKDLETFRSNKALIHEHLELFTEDEIRIGVTFDEEQNITKSVLLT